jgi:hypothetical protein
LRKNDVLCVEGGGGGGFYTNGRSSTQFGGSQGTGGEGGRGLVQGSIYKHNIQVISIHGKGLGLAVSDENPFFD